MTERKEGVRDPIRVSPDVENVVVGGALVPDGFGDEIYEVGDEGYARDGDGNPVHHSTRILATDVDPETWGDHYHHPADCPEKDLPTHRPLKSTCGDCTQGVEREHDRQHYRPERNDETELSADELRARIDELSIPDLGSGGTPRGVLVVSGSMHDSLRRELDG